MGSSGACLSLPTWIDQLITTKVCAEDSPYREAPPDSVHLIHPITILAIVGSSSCSADHGSPDETGQLSGHSRDGNLRRSSGMEQPPVLLVESFTGPISILDHLSGQSGTAAYHSLGLSIVASGVPGCLDKESSQMTVAGLRDAAYSPT